MTAKEFLSQYANTSAEIMTLTEQIQAQRELAEKITVSFESDGSSPGTRRTDKLEACMANIVDLEDELSRRSAELAAIQKDVFHVICEVKDSKLRTLLTMRYMGGKPFNVIAEIMRNTSGEPYSEHHVAHRMHDRALTEVQKILGKI